MKEKRKTRLNKTSGTKAEFLGFGAFADAATTTTSTSTTLSSEQQQLSLPTKEPQASSQALRWSPIYTGKDDHLASLVFPRLIKRDATTKVKALQELQAFFQSESHPKKQQVDALSHYLFLYHSKLSLEAASAVRAEALVVLGLAAQRVPKAFSSLVQQNKKQVLGMMYCCHGDPAAEVRAVAAKHVQELSSSSDNNSDEAYNVQELQAGLWVYVERILSYGRATKMHDDLFATSLKSSSSSSSNNNNKNNNKSNDNNNKSSGDDMNESQRDQLEERFERIVGSALSGMEVWIQRHGIILSKDSTNDDSGGNSEILDITSSSSSSFLWKTLSSPKASLRNRTYVLLGVCCQKAPSIIFETSGHAFHHTIPQALASEKEAGNISSLLEALLAYLAAYPNSSNTGGSGNSGSGSPWDVMNAGTVTKHLVKLFKKSCHGASATQWGPTLLPLLAMLPSLPEQVAVLSAAWKGREQTVRMGDQMVVTTTVSESASFFLLRKQSDNSNNDTAASAVSSVDGNEPLPKVLAQLWLDCLKNFLETNTSSTSASNVKKSNSRSTQKLVGPALQAQIELVKGLAGELRKFDDACYDRPNCALYTIRDWFWSEQLSPCLLEAEANTALAMIVQEIMTHVKDQAEKPGHLSPILREKFRHVLSGFQQTSGAVPTADAYELMIVILKHCGIQVLVQKGGEDQQSSDSSISVEKFLMNDVLKWIVIHTSSLSTQKQSKLLVRNDFTLFGICAADIQSPAKRTHLWESLLKEVIAAKCNLELLIVGLVALLAQDKTTVEQVQCDILDNFVMEVVDDAITNSVNSPNADDDSHQQEDDHDTLKEFLKTCAGLKPGVPALARRQVLTAWVDRTCPSPSSKHVEEERIIPVAILETLLLLAPSALETEEVHRVILQAWTQGGEVWDAVGVTLVLKEPSYLLALFDRAPALLSETLATWSTKPGDALADGTALCWSEQAWRLVELSKQAASLDIEAPVPSLTLVKLGDISLWESTTSHDFHFACLMYLLRNVQSPSDRLSLFQSSTEGDSLKLIIVVLTALSEASVDAVAAARVSSRKDHCAQLLLALGGKGLGVNVLEKWLQSTVSTLERLAEEKDAARIGKYVAVVSQLCDLMVDRVEPRDIFSASDDAEDLIDEFEREKIAKIFVPILRKDSLFAALPWKSSFAELVNVAISQCGVGSERGIGSLHYDIFQLILGAEGRLRRLLEDTNDTKEEDICQELWLLSFSCGYGLNTPSAVWDSELLMFDPEEITVTMLDFVDKQSHTGRITDLGRAMLSWLMTASTALKDSGTRSRAIMYVYQQSTRLLGDSTQGGFGDDGLLGLRGISMAQRASRSNNVDVANLATQAIMQVLNCFCGWGNAPEKRGVIGQNFSVSGDPIGVLQPAWRSLSHFPDIVSSTLLKEPDLMVTAASEFADGLVQALSVESKRWYALRLLDAMAKSASVLGDPTPEEATARRLIEWTKGLDEEEKGELEEDLEIVSEILPHMLMAEMESWSEEGYTDTVDHQVIIGKMLAWLCCLQYVDAFVRKDAANRPSLCAYIDKSGAVHSILNFSILHTDVLSEVDPQFDFDLLLRTEDMVDESTLASLVLFRTVEALPSLTRRWWEDECPKVYTTPMRDFIASHIAPVILQSELERLKFATIKNKFGDMTVSGSVSTREITAMYTQDEIKLKVMIQLPSFFPLRNAEVDCSKTLGVPAKRWKLWALQITMMLNNQGGTLQEALMLWKENVDKEFEGVEPCPVCYSVLHVKTHKLPELECSTCSNRFHSQCLTQWFRSSGKTQCVICQQQWAGTRVKK